MRWFSTAYNVRQLGESSHYIPDSLLPTDLFPAMYASEIKKFRETLTIILRRLDALETIEFVSTFKPVPWSDCKRYNDSGWFEVPNLESYRFIESSYQDTMLSEIFTYRDATRWVLNAVYTSGRPIKYLLYSHDRSYTNSPSYAAHWDGAQLFDPSLGYHDFMDQYRKTLGGLKTLQLKVRRDLSAPPGWFEVMQSLEELRLYNAGGHPHDLGNPSVEKLFVFYPLRKDAILPHLRRLELVNSTIKVADLKTFLLRNQGIEYLDLTGNIIDFPTEINFDEKSQYNIKSEKYSTRSWIEFLGFLRDNLKLKYFSIDITIPFRSQTVTQKEMWLIIKGRWHSEGNICEVMEAIEGVHGESEKMGLLDFLEYFQGVSDEAMSMY
ncbi:hypothetical protein ABW20_dc0105396 [Dactylellina cionopaga]|nr:hypothetical protein ABW20_dc0105396 [Dactylellina cionopaga]